MAKEPFKHSFITIFFIFLMAGISFAVNFVPAGNISMRNTYTIIDWSLSSCPANSYVTGYSAGNFVCTSSVAAIGYLFNGSNPYFNSMMIGNYTSATGLSEEPLMIYSGDSDFDLATFAASQSSTFHFVRSMGTQASPTVVTNNQEIGKINAITYNGSQYNEGYNIKFITNGTMINGYIPTKVTFGRYNGVSTLPVFILDGSGNATFFGIVNATTFYSAAGTLITNETMRNMSVTDTDIAGMGYLKNDTTRNMSITSTDVRQAINTTGTGEFNIKINVSNVRGSQYVVNVRDFGATGDGSTDDTQAIQNAVDSLSGSGGTIYVPTGDYRTTRSIFFNSTNSNYGYIFRGDGYSTLISPDFPEPTHPFYNYTFIVNEHPTYKLAASYPTSPKVIFENFRSSGEDSANMSFIRVSQTGVTLRELKLRYYFYGLRLNDSSLYADRQVIQSVTNAYVRNGGWFYYQNVNGDGIDVSSSYFEGNAFYISKAHGAHIDSSVGGTNYFERVQNLEISNHHFEHVNYFKWFLVPFITVKNCDTIIFRNNWFGNRYNVTMISIDNTDTNTQSSKLYLENNNFIHMCDYAGCTKATDIDFKNLSTSDEIYFKANYGYFNNVGSTTYEPMGFVVNSTGMSTLNTYVRENAHLITGTESNLKYDPQVGWRIATTANEDYVQYPLLANPSISYINARNESSYKGAMVIGANYYYKVMSHDRMFTSAVSSASNETNTLNNAVVEMTVNARNIPSMMRIWRGNSTTYTAYVDIPVNEYTLTLYDQGQHIAGYAWINHTTIPTQPSAGNSTALTIYNGTISASAISANTKKYTPSNGLFGLYYNSTVYMIFNGTCWDIRNDNTHDYTCP